MSKFGALKGLFSKADEALGALKREKGTGAEFLRELEKTPGVKQQEIKDRKLDKVLPAMGKTTKADVQRVLQQNPPPKIEETVLGQPEVQIKWFSKKGAESAGLDQSGYAVVNNRGRVIEGPFETLYQAERAADHPAYVINRPKYGEYTIPGGQNYREILLRLPSKRPSIKDMPRDEYNAAVEAADRAGVRNYESGHWDEPNVLAHARVADRTGPNGERILHIEEIQSDWHQAGRQKGYQTPEKMAEIEELKKAKIKAKAELDAIQRRYDDAKQFSQSFDQKIADPGFANLPPERQAQMQEAAKSWGEAWMQALPELMKARKAYEDIPDVSRAASDMVPDAPFKKNWHELTMKRLLNYAAENGYDRVAITPGVEQAKRYNMSKHINDVTYDPHHKQLIATGKGGEAINKIVQPDELPNYVGKELAEKLMQTEPIQGRHKLSGLDLETGGEGMRGFYDKIIPDYLNNFGKQYGAQVSLEGLPVTNVVWENVKRVPRTTNLHSFDITPQMREDITKRGLPLYQQVGVPGLEGVATGAGAATIGAASVPDNQQVPSPVQFSDNPDAMHLELMQRN